MIEYRTSKKEQRQPNPENRKTTGRKDWGYTNHYRRMMMQRLPAKNEEEEDTH
ncbi:hypothetical protein HC174_09755 [Salinimicrobium sp. CDJ15-81-2]|nr:hypothetical protein [Salinimicrobium nanhaiense]